MAAREDLLLEYSKSLTGFQNNNKKDFKRFAQSALNSIEDPLIMVNDPKNPSDQKSKLFLVMRELYPAFAAPKVALSIELGNSFYNGRRAQVESSGKRLKDPVILDDYKVGSEITNFIQVTSSLKRAILGDSGIVLEDISESFARGLNDVARNYADELFFKDQDFSMRQVFTQSGACTFCKQIAYRFHTAAVRNTNTDHINIDFHNGCNCVFDYSHKGENRAISLSFASEFKVKEVEAKKLIENGEAGFRTLKTGSESWFDQLTSNLTSSRKLNPSESALINSVMRDVVAGVEIESSVRSNFNKVAGDDPEFFLGPIKKAITRPTEDNISLVIARL